MGRCRVPLLDNFGQKIDIRAAHRHAAGWNSPETGIDGPLRPAIMFRCHSLFC
jgi:hypothetical protein